MSHSTSLNLHQLHTVAPPHATTATTFPLTFFDILWLRLPPVERLFFYEFPNPTTTTATTLTTSFFDTIVPNLKHSLSLTLQHFIPLVGNITWPLESSKPIINYVPGDAVSFTVAESNSDFNLLSSNLCDVVNREPLIPRLNISHEQVSVLSLQVTLFPNSGFCVGITTHHAAVDGKSSTMFLKTWAYFCSKLQQELTQFPSSSLPQNLTPFLDRSVISDPSRITEAFVDSWLNFDGPNNRSLKVWDTISAVKTDQVKSLFELTPLHIQKLKKYAQSKVKSNKVSTFSVTCAYLLACLVKVEQPKDERVAFIFSVDCRSRLDPPIIPTYFGNCVFPQLVLVETKKLVEKDGFIIALENIIDDLNKLEEGVLNEGEKWMAKIKSTIGNRLFSTAGSPRFEVYGIDFGWGRPKKVDVTSIDKTGAFSLSESKNNDGGVEIGLALNKDEMKDFVAVFHKELESFDEESLI